MIDVKIKPDEPICDEVFAAGEPEATAIRMKATLK